MAFQTAPSQRVAQLKPAPGICWPRVGLLPSFVHRISYPRMSRSVSGRLRADAPPWRVGNPPPQGSSLGSGLCCPGPSSLNRPHPPHSWTHRDFTAERLIRDALRCAGAPRRSTSGSELSLRVLSWHAVPCDPGEPDHRPFQSAMSAWPSPRIDRLGTPNTPAIRFRAGW